MNRRIMIVNLLLIAVVILISGCVEESMIVNYNTTRFSTVSTGDNITITEITKESRGIGITDLSIVGKVVEIGFRSKGGDVIVFEDGYVVVAHSAENFIWNIGEISKIVIRKDLVEQVGNIVSVEIIIIEVTDK